MTSSSSSSPARAGRPLFTLVGWSALLAGLACHLLAAQAIGGSFMAYRDHVAGFALLTVVSAALLVALGRRFWRGRSDITVLALGAIQLALGVWVYIERFSVHG